MTDAAVPEVPGNMQSPRKAWVKPAIIQSDVRGTEAHVTNFTDGISPGPLHISYGS